MAFAKRNPKIPEGINASDDNPLKDFLLLLAGVSGFVVICVTLLVLFSQSLAPYIPFHYEQKIAQFYEQQFVETGKQEGQAPSLKFQEAEAALQELGSILAAKADLPEQIDLQFHLVNDADVANAFATLGGHIFVTTGLLQTVSSENALAMVVAHEIAHVKLRHPIQALSRGVIVQLFMSLVIGGQDASAVQSVLGQTGLLTLLSFNRSMEHQADSEALDALFKQYGHLKHAEQFFKKMSELGHKTGWKEVFYTHPDVESRIKHIQNEMHRHPLTSQQVVPLDPRLIR